MIKRKLLAENIHKIESFSKGSAQNVQIAEERQTCTTDTDTLWNDTAAGPSSEEAGGIMRQLNLNQSSFYNRYDCNRNGFYVINNINSRLV